MMLSGVVEYFDSVTVTRSFLRESFIFMLAGIVRVNKKKPTPTKTAQLCLFGVGFLYGQAITG